MYSWCAGNNTPMGIARKSTLSEQWQWHLQCALAGVGWLQWSPCMHKYTAGGGALRSAHAMAKQGWESVHGCLPVKWCGKLCVGACCGVPSAEALQQLGRTYLQMTYGDCCQEVPHLGIQGCAPSRLGQAGTPGEAGRQRCTQIRLAFSHRQDCPDLSRSDSQQKPKPPRAVSWTLRLGIPGHAPMQLFPCQTFAQHSLESCPCHLSKVAQVSMGVVESPEARILEVCDKSRPPLTYLTHQEPLRARNKSWCSASLCRVPSFFPLQPRIYVHPPPILSVFLSKICSECAGLLDGLVSGWEIHFLVVSIGHLSSSPEKDI